MSALRNLSHASALKKRYTEVLPWDDVGQKLSLISFVALFPLFYLYHYAIASSLIPPFMGGWFGYVSAVSAVLFLPFFMRCFKRLSHQEFLVFIAFSIFEGVVCLWLAIHFFFGDQWQKCPEVVTQVASTAVMWFALFMVGLYWAERMKLFKVVLSIFLILMATIILTHLNSSNLMFDARGISDNDIAIASYQGLSRSLAFTGLVLLGTVASPIRQLFLVTVLSILLFLSGARSEFFAFLLLVPLMFWVGFRREGLRELIVVIVVMVLLLCLSPHVDLLATSRQMQFFDLDTWTSFQARQDLLSSGWENIVQNPIMGDYAGQVRQFGTTGAYIHNVLSAWRQFGILGFVLYCGLVVCSFYLSLREVFYYGCYRSPNAILTLYISTFCLILVFTAKSVFWPPAALAWGLAGSPLVRTRQRLL